MEHAGHSSQQTQATALNVNMRVDPSPPRAGEPARLSLVVAKQAVGDPLTAFDLLHDRLLHLLIVSDDLSRFEHLHPRLREGVFEIAYTFGQAGGFKLWVEAKPRGLPQILAAFRIRVEPGRDLAPQIDEPVDYRVSLIASQQSSPHEEVLLRFRIEHPDGRPVEDLESLMAAGGHCVVVSEDLRNFLHVHPVEEVEQNWHGGPEVAFATRFPEAGRYKIWGQFQRSGVLITAAFEHHVGAGHH
jgi:hypothetical protein